MIVPENAELMRKYGGPGPRYTSYPSSPFFSLDFDPALVDRELRESTRPLSLYLHIPFCASPCYYCGCHKIVTRNPTRVARYLDDLHAEIDLRAGLVGPGRAVEQLHFGGGTPTYLDLGQMSSLVHHIRSAFEHATDRPEWSIEVDPRTAEPATIGELHGLGFNRLSIGVQDFDEDVQRAVNRFQPRELTERLIRAARQHGMGISVDLIYGLPLQRVRTFARTIDQIIELGPDRVSVFNYAHLPSRFRVQQLIDPLALPSPEEKLRILSDTIERLTRAGYIYIGLDHFAREDDDLVKALSEGTLQRNFQGYSTHAGCDLLGLGISSISCFSSLYAQNVCDLGHYHERLANGRSPTERGIVLAEEDQLRRSVIMSILCRNELRFDELEPRFGIDFKEHFARELEELDRLARDGLLAIEEDSLQITPTGRFFTRRIARAFDTWTDREDSERFSRVL